MSGLAMGSIIRRPITSAAVARAFLRALHQEGMLYHPDESAFECLRHGGFDLTQGDLLVINANMAAAQVQLERAGEDIYEFALALLNGENV